MTTYVQNIIYNGEKNNIAIVEGENRISYGELQQIVSQYGAYLYGIGVRKGDHVGIFARNSAAFVYAYMGIVSLGAVAVPINFQLSPREIAYVIQDAGVEHLLTYKSLDLEEHLSVYDYKITVQQHDVEECYKSFKGKMPTEVEAQVIEMEPQQPCAIIYTSGTTGRPKGAVLSHKNILANIQQTDQVLHSSSDDRVLCILPMYHCFGWTLSVLYPLYAGASVIIMGVFAPKETVELIRREKITDLYVVPSICAFLTKVAEPKDLASVRMVVSGGTTLPLKVAQDFNEKFGVNIAEGYGLSEASPVVAVNPLERVKVGSIGKILPALQYKLLDSEGKQVPAGEAGELVVKGDNVMLGYWNLPEETSHTLQDGWLHTGDVAKIDEDGYLYIVDRIKDIIISMGENVYPREIEELVYKYPDIIDVAVIGVPDKVRGQAGVCYYVASQHIEFKALKQYLRKNLAIYKVPREFRQIAEMPRTDTGKISKVKLQELHKSMKS